MGRWGLLALAVATGCSTSTTGEPPEGPTEGFFQSGADSLRFSLDLPPAGSPPYPAIAFVHGSGRVDRRSQRSATDPLVPHGMAVLRYDKRGVGESSGQYFGVGPANSETALTLLAQDAAAAAEFLAKHPLIDSGRVGLMGNSQGGWISPLAATMSDRIRFLLIWSGPTVSVGLEIFYSDLTESGSMPLDSAYARLGEFNGPFGYDPIPVLRTVEIPSLWLYGGLDRSIPARVDTANIRALQGRGLPFEFEYFPNADHGLRDVDTRQRVPVFDEYVAWLRDRGIL